jgi:hypothetical protein
MENGNPYETPEKHLGSGSSHVAQEIRHENNSS